ncbi:MAG: hypothetical protein RPU42_14550 [Candidatus Sedimenticola sp. (ex Thyasira tokunagai)]
MSYKFKVVGLLDGWKKGDPPGAQQVNIVLDKIFTTPKGDIAITPLLATEQEVDYEVDQLIKGLESIRRKAKSNIKRTNERIYREVSSRSQA